MKRIIRLTEGDLVKLIKRVINEGEEDELEKIFKISRDDYELAEMLISNYDITGNPELSFDQFEESVSEAITDYHIEVMEEAGLIEPILQLNDNELTILYQQTDKAHMHSLINKITLN